MSSRLETERLLLREWKDSDKVPFAAMNADPAVMEFMGHLNSEEASNAHVERIHQHFNTHGYGLYAVELKSNGEFIGFIGLSNVRFEAAFTPAVEIGWRIAAKHWNQGYATEGAQRVLEYAFNEAGLKEVVSFTTESNLRSRRIMEKLGMTTRKEDDFNHPMLSGDHPLVKHVLYRKNASENNLT